MSNFIEPLYLIADPQTGSYKTARELEYHVGVRDSGLVIIVPAGFATDLASVPRILWSICPPHDPKYAAAAVLHDYLYEFENENGVFTHVVADGIFYEAMRVLDTPKWKAIIMYLAVRLFNQWR